MQNKSVKEIKEIVDNLKVDQYLEYIDILKSDERKSVQKMAVSLAKKLDAIRKEEARLEMINTYEKDAYEKGYVYIGGIDEVGRGPLAGPVVAAVVVLPYNTKIEGIDDSKKVKESKREELYEIIKNEALDYGIGIVDNEEIDDYNILNAEEKKNKLNCQHHNSRKVICVNTLEVFDSMKEAGEYYNVYPENISH